MPKVTCKVCAESYDNENHRPMLMPCSRTLCRACVLQWAQKPSQKCFACLGLHEDVNKNNVDNLKVNYDILDVSLPPPSYIAPGTRTEQSSGVLQLVLQEVSGKRYQLKTPASTTVKELKEVIQNQYCYEPAHISLIKGGKIMQEKLTLASYGVESGTILQMVIRYIGGRVPQRGREPHLLRLMTAGRASL